MNAVLALTLLTTFACTAAAEPARSAVRGEDSGAIAPPPSRITEVVVFPRHAEITRELTVSAIAGENQVLFNDLVPILNPHTLRASAPQGARITGTEIKTVYLKEPITEEIASLDRAIQGLNDGLELLAMQRARCDERALFYRSIKGRLSHDMEVGFAAGAVAVEDWGAVLKFVDEGLLGCDGGFAANTLEVRGLKDQLQAVVEKRKDFAGRQPKEKKQVTVSFSAEHGDEVRIQIHYMVDAAIWKPSYDVHLDRAADAIEVIGYGQILQWTGELWEDVELTLAMSRPDHELAVPELMPMVASLDHEAMAKLAQEVSFLGGSAQDQANKWAASRFARRQDRETFRRNLEQLSSQSGDQLKQYGLSHALIEGALSRLVDRFAAVRYSIEQRATIPFDNSPHKVVAFRATVPVQLRYVATPALGDSVMLQGALVNTTGHPVLEGGVSLFVDESYVGAASVRGAARNEGLSFGFGPDDALVVKRKLVSRTVKGPEAFRQSQVITYRYGIVVENFNDRPVDVDVADQIPISKTDDIQVSFLNSSEEHSLQAANGSLAWTLRVEPGATREISYSFSVECPVGDDVHWQ
ncbi:MAG: hypothetical protein ACI9EF_001894 [Pseudohongiellaceae bacterium]|jgi:uncharacterized protein (TIGR02231 family)